MLLGVGGYALTFAIAIINNPSHPQAGEVILIFAVTFLFLTLNFTIGTYGLLDKKEGILSRTDYFFYTKRLKVNDIAFINYRPTWVVGGLTRSLYIIGIWNGKEKVIEFPNVGWYEPVLAKIVSDLKKIKPSIQLDEHAEALIKKYEKNDD